MDCIPVIHLFYTWKTAGSSHTVHKLTSVTSGAIFSLKVKNRRH